MKKRKKKKEKKSHRSCTTISSRNEVYFFVSVVSFSLLVLLGLVAFNDYRKELIKNEQATVPTLDVNKIKDFDLIVFGNEPEAISAALSAAKNGTKTALIYNDKTLGGLLTDSELNYLDIPHNQDGDYLISPLFNSFWSKFDYANTIDSTKVEDVFLEMISKEDNLTLYQDDYTVAFNGSAGNQYIESVQLSNKTINASFYIDATSDGEVVRGHNPYTNGRSDLSYDEYMAVTLVIPIRNVDLSLLKKEADSDFFGGAEYTDSAFWGFDEIEDAYKERLPDTNIRKMNLGISNDLVYINALQVYGVNPLDKNSLVDAKEKAMDEGNHFLLWLKHNFPSFKHAEIDHFPKELYVRESVHYKTLSSLSISDVWNNLLPPNTVALGGYPVDIQGVSKEMDNHVIVNPDFYGIDYGSAVLSDITNTFILGKTAGYDSLAFGSARVIPTGVALAEAIGYSIQFLDATKTIEENYKENIAIKKTQDYLMLNSDFSLDHSEKAPPYSNHKYFSEFMVLLEEGLLWSDYQNDLKLNESVSGKDFYNYMNLVFKKKEISDFSLDKSFLKKEKIQYSDLKEMISHFNLDTSKYSFDSQSDITNEYMFLLAFEILKTHP